MRVCSKFILATVCLLAFLTSYALAIAPSANIHYQKGIQLEKKHDFQGAEREYRLALALDPYDSLIYIKLASLLENGNKQDEALQLYQKAMQLNPKDSMIHLSIAHIWESKNQPAKALEHYKQLLAVNPDYSYVYLAIARNEKALGLTTDASQSYQSFLKFYPKHYDAQRELASLQMSQKQYTAAAETYQSLKTSQSLKFKDNLAYGIALNNADKPEEAITVFEQIDTPSALLYEQMGICYEKLNRLQEAYQSYEKATVLSPKEKFPLYLKMADISVSINRPEMAITSLQTYLKYDPGNAKVTKSLADLYMQANDHVMAEAVYQSALNRLSASDKSARSEVMRNMGYIQQTQGELDKAINTYEKSLALEDNKQVRMNLALAYHKNGNYVKARELYRKLLIEEPDSLTLRKDFGQVLMALGDQAFKSKDYKGAMNYYQDAFLLGNDQEISALLGIANTQYALKNYSMAYTSYQRVLEKDPENLTARLNKAQLDLDQKNHMEALENLRWIVKNKPDYFEAYKMMAQAHEALGDYGQAVMNYQKALEIHPGDTSLLIGYGNVWRQIGDLDRAQRAYEMARMQAPDNAMIRYNLGSVYNLKNQLDASLAEYRAALQLNPSFVEPYYGMGVTFEKQKKLNEALTVYQQYVEKASASSSYIPNAKQRIDILKKSVIKPKASSNIKQQADTTALKKPTSVKKP